MAGLIIQSPQVFTRPQGSTVLPTLPPPVTAAGNSHLWHAGSFNLSEGSQVYGWSDSTGNLVLVPSGISTVTTTPQFVTDDGVRCVRFDGNLNGLAGNVGTQSAMTTMLLMKPLTLKSGQNNAFMTAGGVAFVNGGGAYLWNYGAIGNSNVPAASRWTVVTTVAASSAFMDIEGQQSPTTAGGTFAPNMTIGHIGSVAGAGLNCNVAAVITWNRVLSFQERQEQAAALKKHYGV